MNFQRFFDLDAATRAELRALPGDEVAAALAALLTALEADSYIDDELLADVGRSVASHAGLDGRTLQAAGDAPSERTIGLLGALFAGYWARGDQPPTVAPVTRLVSLAAPLGPRSASWRLVGHAVQQAAGRSDLVPADRAAIAEVLGGLHDALVASGAHPGLAARWAAALGR